MLPLPLCLTVLPLPLCLTVLPLPLCLTVQALPLGSLLRSMRRIESEIEMKMKLFHEKKTA